jgi:hypothetical protein
MSGSGDWNWRKFEPALTRAINVAEKEPADGEKRGSEANQVTIASDGA